MRRRVTTTGAVGIGVGSMLGAGVFVVWGPAANLAGRFLMVALAIAALVALANALSTAQLAARYPEAGGAFAYGTRELGPAWGFLAGAGFLVGKTASVAALGLALGVLVAPAWAAAVATGAVMASWALNARGVTRTAAAAIVLAVATVGALLWIGFRLRQVSPLAQAIADVETAPASISPWSVLAAAGMLFFAFAGYARIATLGEEVRNPARTIPRAIMFAFVLVVAVYVWVGTGLQSHYGARALGSVSEPLPRFLDAHAGVVLGIAVPAAAIAGAMLALTAGVGRTAMAMARAGELPRLLADTNGHGVPARAEALSAAAAIVLIWNGDLRLAISLSAFAVLVYYAIANLAAARQSRGGRTTSFSVSRWVSFAGAAGCLLMAASLPFGAVVIGVIAGSALMAGRQFIWRRRGMSDVP